MNEEELRKEATTTVEWESTPMIDRPTFINGYIVGTKPREKQIAELKESAVFWEERYWILNDMYVKTTNENKNQLDKAKELLQNILDFEDGIITEFSKFDLTRWIIETKQFLKDGEEEE